MYQQLIVVLRWSIEVEIIDVLTEVSCLSQHLCSPRDGYLDPVCRVFGYLQKNLGKTLGGKAQDPMYEPTDENIFDVVGRYLYEWKYFYPDDLEMVPRHIPQALDNYFFIKYYVDSNHARDMANRRLHYGIIIYFNNAPILCYSKRQNIVEASSFGLDFVSLMVATDIVEALRYILRCSVITV